jgi:hypothetical protein
MKKQNFEIAKRIIDRIDELDKEICKIDEYAMIAANGKSSKVSVRFEIIDDQKKEILDEDGSLLMDRSSLFEFNRIMFGGSMTRGASSDIKSNGIDMVFSETLTLQLLGVILREKSVERKTLIGSLIDLGFKI